MDEATWAALAATLTVVGALWTWTAFRRRGAANGLRALGFTLIPVAAWLTGTLEMVTEIAGSVTDWATSLVFNPMTWAGITLAGLSVVLITISGIVRDRQLGRAQGATTSTRAVRGRSADSGQSVLGGSGDELDDIEALLRKRGIE